MLTFLTLPVPEDAVDAVFLATVPLDAAAVLTIFLDVGVVLAALPLLACFVETTVFLVVGVVFAAFPLAACFVVTTVLVGVVLDVLAALPLLAASRDTFGFVVVVFFVVVVDLTVALFVLALVFDCAASFSAPVLSFETPVCFVPVVAADLFDVFIFGATYVPFTTAKSFPYFCLH